VSLLAVHRLLIQTFIVAALIFGWVSLKRYLLGGEGAALAAAIISGVLAVAAIVYLFRAPHLRRK
jgi:Na+-driven multidrug efflux pump